MIDLLIWIIVFVSSAVILRDWRAFPVFFGFALIEGYGVQPVEQILHAVGVLIIVISVESKIWSMKKEDKNVRRNQS